MRVLVRDRDRLEGRSWRDRVELVLGDVLDPATLPAALDGVDAAYYLVHSMRSHADFGRRDLRAARNFAEAAAAEGVGRIIYLGGLGQPETELSEHLRSRQETGAALREAGVPVTEFRASILVGSGSVSFEMIRHLTERLPVMICPRWVYTRTQPIAVDDALAYLVAALETPESQGQIIEIGGRDVLTYKDMMRTYARLRGLRRFIIPVPLLTPRLSSYWVHLVTPIPSRIAQPLIEGLSVEVIVTDDRARRLFPRIDPMDYETAVARALCRAWKPATSKRAGATPSSAARGIPDPSSSPRRRGCSSNSGSAWSNAPAATVYAEFAALGGRKGWPAFNRLWRLRGALDRLVGGVGFRRGRRHPVDLRVGDAVDFWRVEAVEPGRLVRLRAEMKVPGRAWLQFQAESLGTTRTRLVQTAFFAPKGLFGVAVLVPPLAGPRVHVLSADPQTGRGSRHRGRARRAVTSSASARPATPSRRSRRRRSRVPTPPGTVGRRAGSRWATSVDTNRTCSLDSGGVVWAGNQRSDRRGGAGGGRRDEPVPPGPERPRSPRTGPDAGDRRRKARNEPRQKAPIGTITDDLDALRGYAVGQEGESHPSSPIPAASASDFGQSERPRAGARGRGMARRTGHGSAAGGKRGVAPLGAIGHGQVDGVAEAAVVAVVAGTGPRPRPGTGPSPGGSRAGRPGRRCACRGRGPGSGGTGRRR